MTSLIFWGPYLAHKSVINHRREKQRVKNYDRWEGLRDEYDEQRKIARETRSLDIQRTGTWDPVTQQMTGYTNADDNDRGIFTLRDQQDANDARTSWRPQEAWESPRTQVNAQMTGQVQHVPTHDTGFPGQQQQYHAQRHVSSTPAMMQPQITAQPRPSIQAQKTGAAWDEGLPAPLSVSRRSFDDYDYGRFQATRTAPASNLPSRQPSQSRRESAQISRTHTPSQLRESTPAQQLQQPAQMADLQRWQSGPDVEVVNVQELPKNEFGFVDPSTARPAQTAGGRMAELIERGY